MQAMRLELIISAWKADYLPINICAQNPCLYKLVYVIEPFLKFNYYIFIPECLKSRIFQLI
jgi:hypothetical protein